MYLSCVMAVISRYMTIRHLQRIIFRHVYLSCNCNAKRLFVFTLPDYKLFMFRLCASHTSEINISIHYTRPFRCKELNLQRSGRDRQNVCRHDVGVESICSQMHTDVAGTLTFIKTSYFTCKVR